MRTYSDQAQNVFQVRTQLHYCKILITTATMCWFLEPVCGDRKCNKTLGLQCNTKVSKCVCKEGWAQKTETSKCVGELNSNHIIY